MFEARVRLVLRLLYVFRVCCFVGLSVCVCVRTYHVHNNYVKYIVAMQLYFSRLQTDALSTGELLCTYE